MKSARSESRSDHPSWIAIPATLLAGGLSSLIGFLAVRGFENRSRRLEERTASRQRIELLRNRMLGLMEVLHSVAAYRRSAGALDWDSFSHFVREALERHPSILALTWNPWVTDGQRDRLEIHGRTEIDRSFEFRELDADGTLVRAARRDAYVPVLYVRPIGRNREALGYDLASEPERRRALERARDTGEPVATSPLRLVQETEDQLGYLVLIPLYRVPSRTVAERRRNLAGFATAAFRIADMVDSETVDPEERRAVALEVYDHARGLIYRHPTVASGLIADRLKVAAETLDFAGGSWNVVVAPDSQPSSLRRRWQSWAVLGTGLLFTMVVAAYIRNALRRRGDVERQVVLRTRDLSNEIAVRERVENELREAEREYRSIFENSIEGIFQTTPDGKYRNANPALASIYGYSSPDELIRELGDISNHLYVDPARRGEFVRAVRRKGAVSAFESQVRRKDGTVIWIHEQAREVRGVDGQLLYYEGTVQDITERKIAEERLHSAHEALEMRVTERTAELAAVNDALVAEIRERRRAEDAADAANRAKSAFLAHMSHEIRTPLNAILGYAQILQRADGLAPSQRGAVETIANSGSHLFDLVNDILDLSKIEAGRQELQPVPFHLGDLIARMEAMFRHRCDQKGLALAVEVPHFQVAERVQGDEAKLRQVLINLLGNAVKFTDAGRVTLCVTARDGLFDFEVLDTGPGIAAESQAEIFEPFHQGEGDPRRSGSGLGLAISRRCIELMDGTLALESTLGSGSRFHFTLALPPLQEAGEMAAASRSYGHLAEGHHVRALVVDDMRENREVLSTMLEAIGCETRCVSDGPAAIAAAREWRPDIVFMDIWMPGLNGIETTTALLSEVPDTRFVAHSASAFDHEQKRYLEAGFDDFFAKPFRWERVCGCLENLLGVRFESDRDGARGEDPTDLGLPRIALPPEIASALLAATEVHSVTEIRACLEAISALGPDGARVASRLGEWMARYEMDRIAAYVRGQAVEIPASP